MVTVDGQALEFVRYMRSGANPTEALIRDLLAYTQAARLDEPEQTTDANESLTTALANLAGSVTEAGAQIIVDPLPSVRAHSMHLQQLFQNLIGNAIKYRSPERPAVIRVAANNRTGIGYSRLTTTASASTRSIGRQSLGSSNACTQMMSIQGTGIGLAIC